MKIGFLGAGKMARAIAESVREGNEFSFSSRHSPRNAEVVRECDFVVLAVRPQDVDAVAAEVRDSLTEAHVLVSIVAGKTLAKLRAAFGPKVRLVRVMPNLALRAGEGMCAVCGEAATPRADIERTLALLSRAGRAIELEERHFDAVTALAGSGPAYFAFMEAAMAAAGAKLGLPADAARLLAEQTMFGTAKFLRESNMDLRQFINGVCTKGGTTAAGMAKLAPSDFDAVVEATLRAAAERSRELA